MDLDSLDFVGFGLSGGFILKCIIGFYNSMKIYSLPVIVPASEIAFSLDASLDDFLNESDKWTFGDAPHVLIAPFTFEREFYKWFSDQDDIIAKWKPLFNQILEAEAMIDIAQ
jgi:hypothetical protein